MSTFTMQDLNNGVATPEEEEALQAMAKLGGGVVVETDWAQMGKALANHELAHQQAQQARLDAPTPQPTLCESTQTPDLESIINTICTQLQLLSTVIRGERAQGATPPEGNQSLQDAVALTLQQADWFKEMVGACIAEDMVIEGVKETVENAVEYYFDYRFEPSEHFDFGDAVSDAVDDRLDDIVKEKIDECLEEVVAEKLCNANVSISF